MPNWPEPMYFRLICQIPFRRNPTSNKPNMYKGLWGKLRLTIRPRFSWKLPSFFRWHADTILCQNQKKGPEAGRRGNGFAEKRKTNRGRCGTTRRPPAPPSGTSMSTVRMFGFFPGKRAGSENDSIFEHIFWTAIMSTRLSKWLIMATFCVIFSFASPFPTYVQIYTSKLILLPCMWFGLKPSWPSCFHNVFVERWHVTAMHLFIRAKHPQYIALLQSTSKAAAHDVEDVLVSMHDSVHGCIIYFSIRVQIRGEELCRGFW